MTITNYTIKQSIGQGGMASVYLAHDIKFQTNVAIKVLNKEYVHNDNIRKRFIAEARNIYKMSHPNIIKVTDLIDEGDTVAFVMEYIEGETLKEYLERKGKLSDVEIKNFFSQMLEAVGYVHEQNLVHRDIKPSNFMITPKGQIKLLDFGIAKNTDSASAEYTQTGTGIQMGTPLYMSPEQVKSSKEVGASSDIYSLGVVLWQMLMGKKPYDSNTLSSPEIQVSILKEPLPITNTQWDTIIQKATAKEVLNRYESCLEIKKDLGKVSEVEEETNLSKNYEKTIVEPIIIEKKESNVINKSVNLVKENSLDNRKDSINKVKSNLLSNFFKNKKISFLFVLLMSIAISLAIYFINKKESTLQNQNKLTIENQLLVIGKKNNEGKIKYGFINTKGNWIIQPKFDFIRDFHQGLAGALINEKWGFIDMKGNWVIKPKFYNVDYFNDGIARAYEETSIKDISKVGFINTEGNWIIKPEFWSLSDFNNGLALATDDDKEGLIDINGNWTITLPEFYWINDFYEGLASAKLSQNGKYGFINIKGKWIIKPKFDDIGDFNNGLARAQLKGKCGFIDKKGNWIIRPEFDYIRDFHEGLAVASLGEKSGFIDKKGDWLIPPNFDDIGDFNNGLAVAYINGKCGFIDKKGNWVIKPKFNFLENFSNSLALARLNGNYGFIDFKGEWVVKPIFDYQEYPNIDSFALEFE
jgi:serine/threonine protein kinase